MRIIGVDFSGAKTERWKTWLAQGWLEDDGRLTLASCRSVTRSELRAILLRLSEPAVVAMDFPFSVPVEFARHWEYDIASRGDPVVFETMPDLWAALGNWDDFSALGSEFVKWHGEPKRVCDPPESFSPLHKTRPNMVPMTFRGMQMLHHIWNAAMAEGKPLWVPPLPPCQPAAKGHITLLEVMPGAVLRHLGLPHNNYKVSKNNSIVRWEMRDYILGRLPSMIEPVQVDLCHLYRECLHHGNADDALDAVVAAIAAALWHIDNDRFSKPPAQGHNYAKALLEGWLYTPRGHCPQCGDIPQVQE